MVNPNPRSGPIASKVYPSKPNEPTRHAITDDERKEATLLTHKAWMSDPPGIQNCHFLNLTYDEVGPNGVSILPDKPFDNEAEWKYLEGMLSQKVDQEIEDRIKYAHQRLPKLFAQIKTNTKIIYPFRYDNDTGEFMFPEIEQHVRTNICKGNGKARATGFAIPVLGRLPKIFTDTYILKCKIQLTLRLLDTGTESSLRICIGKPCGGIRPLTVGHDDNVFLNGLAQQALQQEIAKHKILPDGICSYQKGKGCGDATIVDTVAKEIAIQEDQYYLAVIDDDAEKMFDRLYIEIQLALLMLAGAGLQGFTEWQAANMSNRTNKIVTDIFVALLEYKCGLPQGNGFSVEVANLFAMIVLLWWNMDPIDPQGTIAPFRSPRHGFPLIAGGIIKPIASMAYVDDAIRLTALLKASHSPEEFFTKVQGYCDLMADMSLVVKMGRNVKKCALYLKHIKDVLTSRKYLGVTTNAQLDGTDGRKKILHKLNQRVGLISSKVHSIAENKIAHNMLVCQVATYSPICITMSLQECKEVDKQLLKAYQYRLKFMPSDAKHSIFLSEKRGGLGLHSFTKQYIGALMRDIEVYISNVDTMPAHALKASIEAATKLQLWHFAKNGSLPKIHNLDIEIQNHPISSKKTLIYGDNYDFPEADENNHEHTHIMAHAISSTAALGFILRDLDKEISSRIVDELLLTDRFIKTIGSPAITNRTTLGSYIGIKNQVSIISSNGGSLEKLLIIISNKPHTHKTTRLLSMIKIYSILLYQTLWTKTASY